MLCPQTFRKNFLTTFDSHKYVYSYEKKTPRNIIFVATSVVLYPDKYHGTAGQHHSLTTVNATTHRDETNAPDTKKQASYHPLNATEYVIKASILVLFGISVVLVMAIFYVYIRQKMYIQPYEASSSQCKVHDTCTKISDYAFDFLIQYVKIS